MKKPKNYIKIDVNSSVFGVCQTFIDFSLKKNIKMCIFVFFKHFL